VRVYLDESLSPTIAALLRARGVDAVSAHEVGRLGADDRSQLRYATEEGRAIVTPNLRDFLTLAADAVRENELHGGIILVSPRVPAHAFSRTADSIATIAALHPGGIAGAVVYAASEA
jgi:hypothetical protein